MAASVDSSGKANLDDMNVLTIPQKTTGMALQTSKVQLGLNFPADALVISKEFNRNDPATYNKSTALTVYDAGGNSYLASVYYVKTQNASQETPNNKWQTYVYVGDKLVNASLQQATNSTGDVMYVNKYGELRAKTDFKTPAEIAELNSSFSKKTVKFSLDALTDVRTSEPAAVNGGAATSLGTGSNDGIDFSNYMNVNKTSLLMQQGSSGVTYGLQAPSLSVGYEVAFGPSAPPVKVAVDPDGTTPPTAIDIAKALNNNASFAGSYVAQAASKSKLSNVQFDSTTPSVNDFKSFSMTLNNKVMSFSNIKLASPDLTGLANALQTRLRNEDKGNADISVTVADATTGSLLITDASGRSITGVSLQTNAATTAVGGAAVAQSPELTITSIDPNVSSTTISKLFSIKQGTNSLAFNADGTQLAGSTGISFAANDTPYPRSVADYPISLTSQGPFKLTFGAQPTDITIASDSGETLSTFVERLKANETFSASYDASVSATGLQITAKDPSTTSPKVITDDLTVIDSSVGTAGLVALTNAGVDLNGNKAANNAATALSGKKSIDELKNLFTVNVDGSTDGVTIG